LDFVIAVKSAQLPARITSALISRQAKARQALARQFGVLLETAAGKMLAEIERLVASRGLDPLAFMDVETIDDIRAGELRDLLAAALGLGDEAKSDWVAYRSRHRLVEQLGLGKLRNLVDSMELAPEAAQAAYHVAHFRSVIGAATRAPNEIPDWSGLHLNGLRSNLAELDREYLAQSRKSVVDKLRRRDVPEGVSQGPVKSLTEKSLIEHEIGKQRRHIPIRALLARAGSAAQTLKPCFMMSPASVSQFLPAMPGWFDIVVIDEASQMRPEEAICAIARGRQAIIVGDPLQLPPTSFFDSTQAEVVAPEEEDGLDIDAESILDKALSALRPKRDLLWHYRSRHDSLIAFSNREFYADRLIVFPSPKRVSDQLGVQYVPVQNGRYKSSINPEEADMVVATVSQIIRDRPDRSIGVVAVNQPQKDLLIERFDRLFAEDSDLEAYRARWAPSLEEFFVKNLENVQGDERDIIVISTVYGPETPGGPVHQRFGPINSNVGHRRLNVLFTRAKERVVLVSSLKAEDIVISEASKPGVRALKRYLEYARSGRLEQGVTGHRTFESPFEVEVAGVLQAQGFEVEPQVGVAGYRIDLAVRSRINRDHFIVGIECDGATYHSAKSARDRDRLRQEILERLGWRLYRIWSADWFLHRDREVRRLAEHIESIQAGHVA
jgi:very-short-patch-repair endonuclease